MLFQVFLICIATSHHVKATIDELSISNDSFCEQIRFPKLSDYDADESILIENHQLSECFCRQYNYYVTCYGCVECKEFPSNIRFNSDAMIITTTMITILKKNALLNNTHLKDFQIKGNDELVRIDPGFFNNMTQLLNLTISQNNRLAYLEKDTFQGLDNLQHLVIVQNGFCALKDFTYSFSPEYIPNLLYLKISHTPVLSVEEDDFIAMENSTVNHFCLNLCSVEHIDPKSFNYLSNLEVLDLSENPLASSDIIHVLEEMQKENIELSFLRLDGLSYIELPYKLLQYIGKTNVTHLSLSKNRFEMLQRFPYIPNLIRLDLNEVHAFNITRDAFQNLPNLRILSLKGNKFSEIPSAALQSQLYYLDLSLTRKFISCPPGIFRNMSNLIQLNLSGNIFRKLSNSCLKGLNNLEWLSLRDSKIYYIENGTFLHTRKLQYLDVSKNLFPTRLVHTHTFIGLNNLKIFKMENCRIAYFKNISNVFINMPNLNYLSLQRNIIQILPTTLLQPLKLLNILDLAYNNLISWDVRLLEQNTNLKALVLYDNKLRNITKAMFDDFSELEFLDIRNNAFICTCKDTNIFRTVYNSVNKSYNRVLDLLRSNQLECSYPEDLNDFLLLSYVGNFTLNRNICSNISIIQKSAKVFGITLLIIIILIFLISYIYRWHIRYLLFLTKLALLRSGKLKWWKKQKTKNGYFYDAFVSYSNEDRDFVSVLVKALEETAPYFKMCVYERDFEIGTVISESVLESVAKSRKTLLIISESYIKSYWCSWEAQVAENHRLFFENEYGENTNDSIVLIKLGDVQAKHIKSQMLKYLMKTKIYLKWEVDPNKEKIFWDKLRNCLKGPQHRAFEERSCSIDLNLRTHNS